MEGQVMDKNQNLALAEQIPCREAKGQEPLHNQ